MKPRHVLAFVAVGAFVVGMGNSAATAQSVVSNDLKPVSAFANIKDKRERSAALFVEAARVMQSPRCLNCHPAVPFPTQGNDLHPHVPYMDAAEGHGRLGFACNTCHQEETVLTFDAGVPSIPGHAHWSLAPLEMAWQGKTVGEICRQVSDPKRNGNRSLDAIHEHMATDTLVGWAWHPGPGRTPAPGTQEAFGKLIAAWIETGAACPG